MGIKILLADDQAMVRAGFRMILETQDDFEVVGEAADGSKTVSAVRDLKPDIVLMDIQMPGMDWKPPVELSRCTIEYLPGF